MVAWLSDWLRDIIAVILIAVFVELLLPNKASRLDKVTVSLEAATKEKDAAKAGDEDSNSVKEVQAIAIDIHIENEIGADGEKDDHSAPASDSSEDEGWTSAAPAEEQAIRGLLAEGWGIAAKAIVVRQQVNEQ
ncbi:hypothetical protein AB4Z21_19555 [Paenibacillus sp. MCAF20]